MKKLIALAAISLSFLAIGGVVTTTTPPAQASSTWCDNDLIGGIYHEYAGYEFDYVSGSQVPLGGGPSGSVALNSYTLISAQIGAWIGVTMGNGHWVQAGIYVDAQGPHEYVEWNDGTEHFYPNLPDVVLGQTVTVAITRLTTNSSGGASSWGVSVDGHEYVITPQFPGKGTIIDYTIETQDLQGFNNNACTAATAHFSNTNHTVANMIRLGVGGPAYTTNVGTNSWDSVMPPLTR